MRFLLPAVGLLLIAVACGGSDDADETAAPTPSPTAVASRSPAPTPTPRASTPQPPSPGAPLYIALGDSLSYGVSASDRFTTSFVPLVHAALPAGTRLLNLGHSGDDSGEIMRHGHLDLAIGEITSRNRDANPDNDVTLVTLEIGGNDLLDLFFDYVLPGTCPTVRESLERPECVSILQQTLAGFAPNLALITDRLLQADPQLNLVLTTLYNPFSAKIEVLDPFGVLSLEGMPDTPFPEGLNDIIRAQAEAGGLKLADVYPLFVGRAADYISMDIIHPNDTGYGVMAEVVIEVLE